MSTLNVDPKLSEFSGGQLIDAAIAISIQIDAIEKDIERMTKYPELGAMYSADLLRWNERLDNLRTFHTQLLTASARKEIERRMISN